ncbi:hypothetical protein PTKU64_88530 [Paraburkholderia terrae]|uniref:Uncharacterized protein n=1 Tax=Paraburkholderia terrae TaxID=311230 RepID=A0ABM7U1N0_9BURK|nr:hypothetical protein PTKU64_88530 [Paraburkholderia terrae]
MKRLKKRSTLAGQVSASCARSAMFQHDQLAFEQRVELGSIHIELVRRLADQHQRCKFVWAEHFRLP